MSDWGEPNIQHRGTVQQILDAREKAHRAVSQSRELSLQTPHPNLAPVQGNTEDTALAIAHSQAVVDYLMHLRPYRQQSENWDIDLGTIKLPKHVKGGTSKRRGKGGSRSLQLCRQPVLPLPNLSHVIETINMTVHYSTNKAAVGGQKRRSRGINIRTAKFGDVVVEDRAVAEQYLSGEMTLSQLVDRDDVYPAQSSEKDDFTPATPTVGVNGEMKKYKIVLPDDQLLRLFEQADEIAADVDMLAEIGIPDHSSGGGSAV